MKDSKEYLKKNLWIAWKKEQGSSFSFKNYVAHVGRMKGLLAIDDFELKTPENILFGDENSNARHFTNFSLRQVSLQANADLRLATWPNSPSETVYNSTG